jgi:hypothetical protein
MPYLVFTVDRQPRHLIHVDQPLLFFLHQVLKGFGNLHLALLGALSK